jgi:hypothetical protein
VVLGASRCHPLTTPSGIMNESAASDSPVVEPPVSGRRFQSNGAPEPHLARLTQRRIRVRRGVRPVLRHAMHLRSRSPST